MYFTQNKYLSQIQNNFLRFLSFQCHIYRAPHSDYNTINRLFSILPLQKRFEQLNLKFLYKLLHNIIDCPELVKRLNFKINPQNSRHKQLFYPPNISTKYMLFSPSNTLMAIGNSLNDVDLFHCSLNDLSSYMY